jgi:hypothetical protein
MIASLGAGAGYVSLNMSTTVPPATRYDAITETSFQVRDGRSPENPPTITFDSEANRVRITGDLFVGSEKCKKAKLTAVEYTAAENFLRIEVTDGKTDLHPESGLLPGGSCVDGMSPDAYTATITFRDTLPQRVTAVEDAYENTQSTTASPE